MVLQRNILSTGYDPDLLKEPLLASEILIDDIFLINKHQKRLLTTITAGLLLFVLITSGIILLKQFLFNNPASPLARKQRYFTGTTIPGLPPNASRSSRTGPPRVPPPKAANAPGREKPSVSPPSPTSSVERTTPAGTTNARKKTGGSSGKSPGPSSAAPSRTALRQPDTRSASGKKPAGNRSAPKPTATPASGNVRTPSPVYTEGSDNFDRSEFYLPATAGKSSRRSPTAAANRGDIASGETLPRNKIPLIANLAQQFDGQLYATLERNGDYYKLKLALPDKQVMPFKKALAKMVQYASYTDVPEESIPGKRCVILEAHIR